jgi:hypothetical protein
MCRLHSTIVSIGQPRHCSSSTAPSVQVHLCVLHTALWLCILPAFRASDDIDWSWLNEGASAGPQL